MRDRHRIARRVVAALIVLLACLSAPDVKLDYAPDVSFPELAVVLRLPPEATADSAEVTRQWVVPIEGSLRGIGETVGTRGEVGAGTATIVARFERGVDATVKAARLESDLAPLRARLPRRATLAVFVSGGRLQPNVEFAITGPAAGDLAQRIAEELRSLPGVRDVQTFGTRRSETEVRMLADARLDADDVIGAMAPHPIGETRAASHRAAVVAQPLATRVADVRLAATSLLPLASVAAVRQHLEEPQSLAKLDGAPAAIIAVYRDADAQLLPFDRAVTRLVGSRGTKTGSDAGELLVILRRLAVAAFVAALILGFGAGARGALYVPLAIAATINVWRIGALRVDAQTLLLAAIAIAAVAPFAVTSLPRRALVVAALFVALLPVAAEFGSGALAPLLAPAARGFAVAALCALAATLLLGPNAPHPAFGHLLPDERGEGPRDPNPPEGGGVSRAGRDAEGGGVSRESRDLEGGGASRAGRDAEGGGASRAGRDAEGGGASRAGRDVERGGASLDDRHPEGRGVSRESCDPEGGGASRAGRDLERGGASREGRELQSPLPRRRERVAEGRVRATSIQSLLRNSASVLLACFACGIVLLSWFGARLDPRRSQGSAERSRAYVRLQLPSGSTLEQAARAASAVERVLHGVDGVRRFWTSAVPGSATVVIELAPALEQPQRFDLFRAELLSRVPAAAGSLSIENAFDRGSATSLAESMEEQPYADETGREYRFLLKGVDAEVLRRAADELTTRLARGGVSRDAVKRDWPEPSPRIELLPQPAIAPRDADAAAAELTRLSVPPAEREMANGTVLRVAAAGAPLHDGDVPRRDELFARPLNVGGRELVVESAFAVRRGAIEDRVTRELGRFVLPVTVAIRSPSQELMLSKRRDVDRIVAVAPLPAGVVAERPQLDAWRFPAAKLRLLAVAAFLPILLFTAAVIVLSSFVRALVAVAPAALGTAFVAPALTAADARLDEITLLAAGAAVCCVAALSAITLLRVSGATVVRTYRTMRDDAWPLLVATAAGAMLAGIAATAQPSIGDAWRGPLLASAAVLAAGMPASLLLPGTLGIVLREAKRRRGAEARAAAQPAAWRDASPPRLSVRNVTKVYAGGHRALHRISFDLQPGVVGLLGPNGAGKTTLLRIITGLLQPSRGVVSYRGVPVRRENVAAFRQSIGFLPQEFNAYAGLTAAQFLDFWALERGIDDRRARREQIGELLAVVGLEEHANRRVREFSGGMRQRIGIARALLGDPPVLVVDEPTTGLDIEARRRFRDLLIALARDRIVILSSHIASDVETTAMHLLLLARGELRWQGSVEQLLRRAEGRVFESMVADRDVRELARRYRLTARVRVAGGIRVRGVVAAGEPLPGSEVRATLEEAYLSEVSTGALRTGSFAFVFERRSSS